MPPWELLEKIEQTPWAFLAGRRNNDMVNWYIAQRLNGIAKKNHLVERFKDWMAELVRDQDPRVVSLRSWDESWEKKLNILFDAYWHCGDEELKGLWLPMDYQV